MKFTDPELVNDHKTADILENREIWFRYKRIFLKEPAPNKLIWIP
jgi:hypothetical protein